MLSTRKLARFYPHGDLPSPNFKLLAMHILIPLIIVLAVYCIFCWIFAYSFHSKMKGSPAAPEFGKFFILTAPVFVPSFMGSILGDYLREGADAYYSNPERKLVEANDYIP